MHVRSPERALMHGSGSIRVTSPVSPDSKWRCHTASRSPAQNCCRSSSREDDNDSRNFDIWSGDHSDNAQSDIADHACGSSADYHDDGYPGDDTRDYAPSFPPWPQPAVKMPVAPILILPHPVRQLLA